MEIFSTIVRFFQHGGVFMFPIAVILGFGLAVAIERWLYLGKIASKNRSVWRDIMPMLNSGDFNGVAAAASKSDTAIGDMLSYGLNRVRMSRSREDIERAMEEGLMEAIPSVEKRTHYLATFANVATLLGLLGTIAGLIHAFGAVGDASAAEKAALLSSSISEALNCTAFGLMVAIPMMLVHSLLQSRATEIVDSLEAASVKFLNAVTDRAAPAARPEMAPRPAAPAASSVRA